MSTSPTTVALRKSWQDLSVVCTEHAPAAVDTLASAGPTSLTVALLPVERALWRVDGGSTRAGRIIAGTTSARASREVVWARWDQPCKCIHISLQPQFLKHVAAETGATFRELEYREGIHDPTVLNCALLLAEEAASPAAAGDLYVQSIANLLAVHVLRTYAGATLDVERGSSLSALSVQRVKDYIDANVSAPLLLETLAKVAGTSPFHFARNFKAATGLPPHRYLTVQRIERAKTLLASTSTPIADVASWVGFSNQSHFTGQFRKLVGRTPKQFRDAARPRKR
jgi:AraC family transcriptional regulator